LKKGGQKVTLDFLDSKGQLIRKYSSDLDSTWVADSVRMMASEQTRIDSLAALGVMADAARKPGAVERPNPFAVFESGWRYIPLPSVPNKAGANSFTWNTRYPDGVAFNGLIMWSGN